MSLSFLTPDAVGEAVAARSPMERLARAAGARMELRDGWNVAVAYGDGSQEHALLADSVGFADRSSMLKLELQARPDVLARIVAAASGVSDLEPGRAVCSGQAWWCPVTPARVLVLGAAENAAPIRAAVAGAAENAAPIRAAVAGAAEGAAATVTVVDLTCGLAALALAGPGASELLARFCAIDVRPTLTPVGAFRPGSVARTPGYVLRDGDERLLVLVGWALGQYLWTVVADAAEDLDGGPVGFDALPPRVG